MMITNLEQLKKENKITTYSCGSKRLAHAIETQLGLIPIKNYRHHNTGRLVSVFIMCDELSRFLTEWTKHRPSKAGGKND